MVRHVTVDRKREPCAGGARPLWGSGAGSVRRVAHVASPAWGNGAGSGARGVWRAGERVECDQFRRAAVLWCACLVPRMGEHGTGGRYAIGGARLRYVRSIGSRGVIPLSRRT